MTNQLNETFKPFLWALVERSTPSPIFAIAFTGISVWLCTELPEDIQNKPLEAQIPIIKDSIRQKHKERPGSPFGKHLGYVFVRTPEEFHEFDTKGQYVGIFDKIIPHMTATARLTLNDGTDMTETLRGKRE